MNLTIDDTYGDPLTGLRPIYTPSTAWSEGRNCQRCLSQPRDLNKVYNGTWHDATHDPFNTEARRVEMSFLGTAVYVYAILDNRVLTITTATYVEFFINGTKVGEYAHPPTGTDDLDGYLYNVPIYSNESLPNGTHTLAIATVAHTNRSSLLLFDYVQYTGERVQPSSVTGSSTRLPLVTRSPIESSSDTSSPTTVPPSMTTTSTSAPQKSPIGVIVGGVVGGLAVVILIFVAFLFWWRRNTQHVCDRPFDIEPQPAEGTNPPGRLWAYPAASGSRTGSSLHPAPAPDSASFSGVYVLDFSSRAQFISIVGANGSMAGPPSTTDMPPSYPSSAWSAAGNSRHAPGSSVSSWSRSQPASSRALTTVATLASTGSVMTVVNQDDWPHSVTSSVGAVRNGPHPTKQMRSRIDARHAENGHLRADRPNRGLAPPAYEGAPMSPRQR